MISLQVTQNVLDQFEFTLVSLDTESLKILLPTLPKKYPTKSSVIVKVSTPKYSLEDVSFRMA